jgi:hypothetical protein
MFWYPNLGPSAGFFDLNVPKQMVAPIVLSANVGSSKPFDPLGGTTVSYGPSSFTDIDGDGNIDAVWSDGYNNTELYSVGQEPTAGLLTTKWSVHLGDGLGAFHEQPSDPLGLPYGWPVPEGAQVSSEVRGLADDQGTSQSLTNLVDVNGDGLVDLVHWYSEYPDAVYAPSYALHGSSRIYLNSGTGFAHSGQWDEALLTIDSNRPATATNMSAFLDHDPAPGDFKNASGDSRVRFSDFDSDGRPDLFSRQAIYAPGGTFVPPYSSPTTPGDPILYINPGLGTLTTPLVSDSIVTAAGFMAHEIELTESQWEVTHDFIDLSGDGEPEMVEPKQSHLRLANRDTAGQPLRLLNTIDNGNGGLTEITYAAQNDPTVAAASQADYAVMPRHMWVVKEVTTTDTTTGLTAVQDVKYGSPVWNENDRGKWGFRGFTSIVSSSAHAVGATTGFRKTVKNYGYDTDWSGRLDETLTYGDDGLASIQRANWEAYELFGGSTKSFHNELGQSTVCEGSCAASVTTYSRSSYVPLKSADTSDGIELAWVRDVSNLLQELAPIAPQTAGDLEETFDYELHSSASKYWLLQTESKRYVFDDSTTAGRLIGHSKQEADSTETYAETRIEYFDAATFTTSRTIRDPQTGLVVEAITPELDSQFLEYSGFKVHATLHRDFGAYESTFETDLGTGLVTRAESPNTVVCGSATDPEASTSRFDGLGRFVEQRQFGCVSANDYDDYKTLVVEYFEQGFASPMYTRIKAYEDFAGLEFPSTPTQERLKATTVVVSRYACRETSSNSQRHHVSSHSANDAADVPASSIESR